MQSGIQEGKNVLLSASLADKQAGVYIVSGMVVDTQTQENKSTPSLSPTFSL